jgi:DNA-directed RNA polymerase alpha subunit
MAVVHWRDRVDARKAKELKKQQQRPLEDYKLSELELGFRAERILKELGCETLSDVLEIRLRDLDNAHGCGRKTFLEITATLGKYGYALKG